MTAGLLAALLLQAAAQTTPLTTPAEDARVAEISETLRCVVCQNQSIAESDAPLAADMRRVVEDRVRAGDSDDEVRAYLEARYGEYVLLRPKASLRNAPLWIGPVIVLALGAFAFWQMAKHGRDLPFDEEEAAR